MTDNIRSKLAISRVTIEDLPALAEADILAYLGNKIISTVIAPNRWALRDSGAPVKTWVDYEETIERRKRDLVSNETLYKVSRSDDQIPLGMVSISFPGTREDRTWSDWIWGDYLYPLLKYVGISEKGRSVDKEALGLFFATIFSQRDISLRGKVYATV